MQKKVLAGLLWLLATGCGLSREDFGKRVEEAQACRAGDTCALAGAGECTCDAPVNASRAQDVDAAARSVACGGTLVECVPLGAPRCEAGRCTADPL